MRNVLVSIVVGVMCLAAGTARADAQERTQDLSVRWGAVNYDLSGTGTSTGFAVRSTRALWGKTSLEVGTLVAFPLQQTGDSTVLVPEAHLQYHWTFGRVSPYVTGGGGMAIIRRSGNTDVRPVLSTGGGARFRLNEQVDLQGEFRLRGVSSNFSGTMAEWLAGLAWRL